MFVTDDDAIAERVRLMSLHGISRDAWKRYTAGGSWYYEIEDAGYKYNMTDMAAVQCACNLGHEVGLVQLDRAEELLGSRLALVERYRRAFREAASADLLEMPTDADDGSHAWHLFIVRLQLDRLRIDRAAVMDGLAAAGIGASVHFIPLHKHPYHRRTGGWTAGQFPVAEREYPRVISLPLWPGMTDRDLARVADGLRSVLEPARA